jgi:bifunctional oligoribonuclease and PAP phosphatase NrnA
VTDARAVRSRAWQLRPGRPLARSDDPGHGRTRRRRSDLDRAAQLLADARSVVLIPHIYPDADALGSALALGMGLRHLGKQAWVSFAEPNNVPESLRGLPGRRLIVRPAEVPDRPDLVVSVDVGSVARLGSLVRLLDTAGRSLVVDHHASNTRFGQYHLVDAAAESTTVLVLRLLDLLGVPLDRPIAENIYAGLATDTGHFRHVGSDAHRLAARLLDAGVRPPELLLPITDTHPFGWFGMLSRVLGTAVLEPTAAGGYGLVYAVIDSQTADGLRSEELDSVIDILRTAQEAGVAAVFKQTNATTWQVSLRSGPSVDVSAVAAALGGGGHVRAAGFTHHGPVPAPAIDALLKILGR